MSEEVTVRHVQKLDGSNFLSWKFQMNAVFVAAGVSEIVDGLKTMPADPLLPAAATWRKDNAKAMMLISSILRTGRRSRCVN